jgi:hypothetical protein
MRRSLPSKKWIALHTAVAAETIFGERSIDVVGEPQWIVAVILGTGHSLVPDALIAPALARWISPDSARRVSFITVAPPQWFPPARAPTSSFTKLRGC